MQLTIEIDEPKPDGEITGTLADEHLALRLFKSGRVRLNFTSARAEETREEVLDEFVTASLNEFLAIQDTLEQTLHDAFRKDRETWRKPKKKFDEADDLWAAVRFESLDLRKRKTTTSRTYMLMVKTKGPEFAAKYVGVDPSDLKSAFVISFRCKWDREHLVRAEFENGQLKRIDHS